MFILGFLNIEKIEKFFKENRDTGLCLMDKTAKDSIDRDLLSCKQKIKELEKNTEDIKEANKQNIEKINSLEKELQDQPTYELISLLVDKSIHKSELNNLPDIDILSQLEEEGKEELLEVIKEEFKVEESDSFGNKVKTVSFEYYRLTNNKEQQND